MLNNFVVNPKMDMNEDFTGLADIFEIPTDTPNGSPNDSSECSSRDDFSAGRLTAKQLHGQSILGPRSRQLWVEANNIVQTLEEVSEIRSDEIMKIPLRDVDVDHEILTPGSKKGKTCLPKDYVSTSYLSRIKTPPPDQKVTDMEEKFGNENTNKVTLAEQRPVITPATATHITSNLWANTFNIKGATPKTLAEEYYKKENAVDIDLQNQKSKLSGQLGVTSSLKIRSNREPPVTDRSAGQKPEQSTQTEICRVGLKSGIVFLNTQTALGGGPLNDPKERGGLKKVITPKGKTKISEDLLGSRVPMTTRTSVVAELKEDGESKAADSVGDDADFVQENLRTTPKQVHAEVPKKLLRTVEQQTPKWKCDSVEPLRAAVKKLLGMLEDKAKAEEEWVAAAKQVMEPVKDRSKALLMELDQKHESVGYLPGIRRLITTPKGKEEPVIEDVKISKKPVKTSRQKCDIEECPMSFRGFYAIVKMEPIGRKHGFLGKLRRKSGEVKNLTGMRVPREKPKLLENLTGIRRFFKTARVKPAEHLTSMEKMDMTSKEKESVEDLTVIKKLRSPKKTKGQSMEDLIGSKKLMKTPKPKDQSVNQRQKKICCRSYEEAENTSNISKIYGLYSVNVEDHIMMDQEVLSLPNERNKISRILQECDELPNETKSIITEKEAEDFLPSFPDEKNAFVLNDDGQIMVSVRSKAKDKSVESLDEKIVVTSWEKNVKERIVRPKARSLSPWHKGERREPVKGRTRMFRDVANKVDVRVPLIPIKRDQAAKKTRASSALADAGTGLMLTSRNENRDPPSESKVSPTHDKKELGRRPPGKRNENLGALKAQGFDPLVGKNYRLAIEKNEKKGFLMALRPDDTIKNDEKLKDSDITPEIVSSPAEENEKNPIKVLKEQKLEKRAMDKAIVALRSKNKQNKIFPDESDNKIYPDVKKKSLQIWPESFMGGVKGQTMVLHPRIRNKTIKELNFSLSSERDEAQTASDGRGENSYPGNPAMVERRISVRKRATTHKENQSNLRDRSATDNKQKLPAMESLRSSNIVKSAKESHEVNLERKTEGDKKKLMKQPPESFRGASPNIGMAALKFKDKNEVEDKSQGSNNTWSRETKRSHRSFPEKLLSLISRNKVGGKTEKQ